MDQIVMQGIVDQPLCYSDWGEIEFVVHTLTEDENFVHIKGDVGYLDTRVDTVKSEEHEFKVSHYDGIEKDNNPSSESDLDINFPVRISR